MADAGDDPDRKTDPPDTKDVTGQGEDSSVPAKPVDLTPSEDRTVFPDMGTKGEDESEEDDPRTMISTGEAPAPPAPADSTVIGEQPAKQVTRARVVEPGTLINNNYRIISLISAGGMGEVYRAENVFTGDPVAVKVILPDLAQDESVLDMFRREARVLVQLRDEAIVRYHNFVLDGGLQRYCLIMEFVEGRHLGARVKEDGPLSDEAAITLMRRLALGLQRAHERGVTHRDLSPDNVILRDDRIDEAVLIDFGIARSTELGDGLAGRFAGKFKYIAPEQLGHAGGDIQPATDVYGLALLMAMVLRGKPLDMGDSIVSASAARQAIPDLTGVPHRLMPLLQHMLEPDPGRRPETMRTVLQMLSDPVMIPAQYRLPLWSAAGSPVASDDDAATAISDLTGTAAAGDSSSPFALSSNGDASRHAAFPSSSVEKTRGGRRAALIAISLAFLVAAAGGAWWVMKRERPQEAVITENETQIEVPKELAARDESTREGFLASQSMPECSFADRISTGRNAGMLSVLSKGNFQPASLADAYENKFGVRPAIVETRVLPQHCPVLDFLREVSGRPAEPPVLTAEIRRAETGYQLIGRVGDDSVRNIWLFLVSPDGGVYDLTGQSSETSAGRDFGVGISAVEADTDAGIAPFLLVALTSEKPIAAVAAAPSGASAGELLPRVLEELRGNEEKPAVSALALRVETPPDSEAASEADEMDADQEAMDNPD